jgi:peroxin-5
VAQEHDLALARQFFEGNAQSLGEGPSFASSHLLPLPRMTEVNGLERTAPWSIEQQDQIRAFDDAKLRAGWATEFRDTPQLPLGGQHGLVAQAECSLPIHSCHSI